ncbi:MAG: hypothetical protein B7Y51_05290 [Burkholderiales bacterium 28-67-8]|nr:MAG: hypothetical protein B7Y51_05290 [Burkholderiales bacterium 28-67-8]
MKADTTGSKVTGIKATVTKAKPKPKVEVPTLPMTAAKATGRHPTAAHKVVGAAVSPPVPKPARRSRTQVTASPPVLPSHPIEAASTSKQSRLISLLRASSGATLKQMMALTGWQAHTVRGAISGVLRKRLGLNVVCEGASGSGARCYRIVAAAA